MMKKLLSLLLAVTILTVTLLPLSASAETTNAGEGIVPRVVVTTAAGNGTSLEKADGYVDATITITDVDGSTLSDSVLFKVRGNSTALSFVTKKAYTFKFDKKKNVLGMGKGKKWAMLANTFDPTLMRNYIALDLAKKMGIPFTSEQRYVELWLDGSFRGCYQLVEPVEQGKDRVNIDIESNGGLKDFMIEREATRVEDDVTYFTTDGIRFSVSEPDAPTDAQLAYIQSTMDGITNVLKSGDRAAIEAAIDVPSFARFYLLNELLKTVDFDFSSVNFHYRNGKLYAGPAWDYDLSAGNANAAVSQTSAAAADPEGSYAGTCHLYKDLYTYSWFKDEVKSVYRTYYDDIAGISAAGGVIDTLLQTYGDVFARNYSDAGWKVSKWWVNVQKTPLATFDENVSFLRTWTAARHTWLSEASGAAEGHYLRGDADGDGAVTVCDATLIQRVLACLSTDDDGMIALRSALTGDSLNILHATLIQRYIADLPISVPVGVSCFMD